MERQPFFKRSAHSSAASGLIRRGRQAFIALFVERLANYMRDAGLAVPMEESLSDGIEAYLSFWGKVSSVGGWMHPRSMPD